MGNQDILAPIVPQIVFVAQIIDDEDAEEAPTENANAHKSEDQDESQSQSHESDHKDDHSDNPAKPVTLQLGCSGSQLKVNFATVMSIKFTSIDVDTYLDIANLEI